MTYCAGTSCGLLTVKSINVTLQCLFIVTSVMFSCSTTSSLQGLKFIPWCLDYWVDSSDMDQSVLTIGDTGGQVRDSWRKTKEERETGGESLSEL